MPRTTYADVFLCAALGEEKYDEWKRKEKMEGDSIQATVSGAKPSPFDGEDQRTCSCHPDDSPPAPCPRKFALTECRQAELEKLAELNRYDSIGRVLDSLLKDGELEDYDSEIANRIREAAKIVRAVTVMHFVPLRREI